LRHREPTAVTLAEIPGEAGNDLRLRIISEPAEAAWAENLAHLPGRGDIGDRVLHWSCCSGVRCKYQPSSAAQRSNTLECTFQSHVHGAPHRCRKQCGANCDLARTQPSAIRGKASLLTRTTRKLNE